MKKDVKELNRLKVLRKLDSIKAGVERRDTIPQSSMFIFQDGYAYSCNESVVCRVELDLGVTGAISATPLIDILSKYDSEKMKTFVDDGVFVMSIGGNSRIKMNIESDIIAPVETFKFPSKFNKVPRGFSDMIRGVKHCVGKDLDAPLTTMMHITPDHMESCNLFSMCRAEMSLTKVGDFLIKGDALIPVAQINPVGQRATRDWWHFQSDTGAIYSARIDRASDQYPELSELLSNKGEPLNIPKHLKEVCERMDVFCSENDDDMITVRLGGDKGGNLGIKAVGASGSLDEKYKIKYDGEKTQFQVSSDVLKHIITNSSVCEISESAIKMSLPKLTYVSALQVPGNDGGE